MKKSNSAGLEIDGPVSKADVLKQIQDLLDAENPGDMLDSTASVKVCHNRQSISTPPAKVSPKKKKT